MPKRRKPGFCHRLFRMVCNACNSVVGIIHSVVLVVKIDMAVFLDISKSKID